ncbi:hypothetical protein WOLCODRAFT_137469 [Wolfiporia cocos MD-104 SS10]|uniref:Uncharacterized protein n=1 Tax=Wolfiporia cocos (strain MD-104) TaxID=742152 RepID=A0A2H3JI53_WOLCO|nr:hypothetical protein WOLCODRAFT_137469 [Wolfiporia cocos MD-104 SS10]
MFARPLETRSDWLAVVRGVRGTLHYAVIATRVLVVARYRTHTTGNRRFDMQCGHQEANDDPGTPSERVLWRPRRTYGIAQH